MRPADLAQRLSRATRRRHAQLRFLGEAPYGPRLTVRSWRLGNGLRVHTLVDSTTPVVSYQSWFGVGSRHEEPARPRQGPPPTRSTAGSAVAKLAILWSRVPNSLKRCRKKQIRIRLYRHRLAPNLAQNFAIFF